MHALPRTTTRLTPRLSTVFGNTVPSPGFSREFRVEPRFALTVEKHEGNHDSDVDVKLKLDGRGPGGYVESSPETERVPDGEDEEGLGDVIVRRLNDEPAYYIVINLVLCRRY
jgi:hypothetical protein